MKALVHGSMGATIALFLTSVSYAQSSAKFDYVEYRAVEDKARQDDETYRIPVLPGFHPDPSIVKVGQDFYLVT